MDRYTSQNPTNIQWLIEKRATWKWWCDSSHPPVCESYLRLVQTEWAPLCEVRDQGWGRDDRLCGSPPKVKDEWCLMLCLHLQLLYIHHSPAQLCQKTNIVLYFYIRIDVIQNICSVKGFFVFLEFTHMCEYRIPVINVHLRRVHWQNEESCVLWIKNKAEKKVRVRATEMFTNEMLQRLRRLRSGTFVLSTCVRTSNKMAGVAFSSTHPTNVTHLPRVQHSITAKNLWQGHKVKYVFCKFFYFYSILFLILLASHLHDQRIYFLPYLFLLLFMS